jgi:hypothetical protein
MKTIILILVFIPFISYSQLIKSSQTDSFTQQKRIVTKSVDISPFISIRSGLLSISFNTVNDNIFIVLHGEGKSAGTITQDDIALLITEKDTIVIKSVGLQISYGRWEPSSFDHQYLMAKDDLIKLSKNKLVSVRRYTSEGIFDLSINGKFQGRLMPLCDALLREMKII